MRDIPAVGWILAITMVVAVSLFLYSRGGPPIFPVMKNAWAHVDSVEEALANRKIDLKVGETLDEVVPPYRIRLARLTDLDGVQVFSRYLLRIRPLAETPHPDPWLKGGVELALVDSQPRALLGSIQLVSVRKTN
jgi:hypothetical protein